MAASLAAVSLAAGALLAAVPARAQTFPPVVDRNFNIDLFEQPAVGSPRLIAMAGAVGSVAEGAAGLYTNPASAAVRPETRAEKFAWNVYFNSYVPVSGQDSNNNGQTVTTVRRSLLGAVGLLLQYGDWGLTLDGGYTAHEIAAEAGGGLGVRSVIPHLAVARAFTSVGLAVGVGVRGGSLNVYTLGDNRQTLFTRFGMSAETGVVWAPREQSFRMAATVALPVHTPALRYTCDPADCAGYILPTDAVVPWQGGLSAAWRWGPGPWNHRVDGAYRDERQLTIAVDLTVMGPIRNGYGMEAFAGKQLQASGRDPAFTPRLGAESEVIKGWLRLRGGTYREPTRFAETEARWHGTMGAEVRLFRFHLLNRERRVSLSLAADLAPRYQNAGVSLGFWN